MLKPLAKVKVGDLLKAEKMNDIIERINILEKRLDQMEGRASQRNTPKVKTPRRKTLKVKTPKRKTIKGKNPKRKTLKRKSPKTGRFSLLDLVG